MNTNNVVRDHLVDEMPRLQRIVRKVAYDQGLVDDIFQECCTRIIEKENLWNRDLDKLSNWMSVLTRNTTLTLLKRGKKTKEGAVLNEDYNLATDDHRSDFSENHIRWLVKEFSELTDRQKIILKMRYFDGMKLNEIGKELGISHSTVIEHIKRSIEKMRRGARKEGLLLIFLPWNWNFKAFANSLLKLMLLNSITEVTSLLLVLSGITFVTVKIAEQRMPHISSNLTHDAMLFANDNNISNPPPAIAPEKSNPSVITTIMEKNYSKKYRMEWMDKSWEGFILTPKGSSTLLRVNAVELTEQGYDVLLRHGKINNEDELNINKLSLGIPKITNPQAIIEFTSASSGKNFTQTYQLNNRAAGTIFSADIKTPTDAAPGTAKMLIHFPTSTLNIKPAVYEVPVEIPFLFK